MPRVQTNLKLTLTTSLGADKLLISRLQGEERLSGLFHYVLELHSEDAGLAFDKIVNTKATVSIALDDGAERHVNGYVTRFVQAGSDGELTRYVAELRPNLWLLSLSSDARIFQELSTTDIIEQVFSDHGLTDYKLSTTATYEKREYCVQYKETAFDFVSRLMEEEGIFYFFEHSDSNHKVILGDAASVHKPCVGPTEIDLQTTQMDHPDEAGIIDCRVEEALIPKTYAVSDYYFETPAAKLVAKATSKAKTVTNELYEFPGGYRKKGRGEDLASLRLERFEWERRVLTAQGFSRGFTSGCKFTLSGHKRSDANGEYVIEWLSLNADPQTYSNSFRAFPASLPYRPQPETPRPRMTGSETAVVTGKKGEEIFADKYGRIKVQFHWDRYAKLDEKSSCWIRVAQPWAGAAWGSQWIPRIGQEVVVQYVDGDPDRPLVTGAVYNGDHAIPYDPSKEPTKSTIKSNSSKGGEGFNEIRFEDKKDSEEFYAHAQKDMLVVVEHDRVKNVLNDETNTIKKNRTTTVEEEHEKLIVKKGDRTVKVEKGKETHHVEATRKLSVKGDETHLNDANFTQKVKGNYTLKVKGNITIEATGNISIKSGKTISTKAKMSIKNDAGMSIISKAKMSIKSDASMSIINTAKMAIKNTSNMQILNKASMMMKNDAGMMLVNKGGLTSKVEGGVLLSLKGAIAKMN